MKVVDSTSEESGRRDGNMTRLVSYWAFAFTLTLVVPALAEETSPPSVAEKLFVNRIEPLFVEKCGGCHGENAKEFKGELDMRTRAGLVKGGESGDPALVPGSSDKSSLVVAIEWRDGVEMPPKENDRLTKSQIADVREWIDAGAPWPDDQRRKQFAKEEWRDANVEGVTIKTSGGLADSWTHRRYQAADLWAYRPIQQVKVPLDDVGRSKNPIDAFVNRKQIEAGVTALGIADRATLIRRLSYDLTGLPPTAEEIQQFVADESPNAFAALVDRLLESPHYGEHWGKHWLDVVRYADSAGFANDFPRPNAWRYRDYVIRSLNADKPYDQFMSEQIAGDEISPNDPDSLIAVGYLRMGPWEHTAMSVAAVTRQQFLDDVTNSVGVTFLAHELRCASCHDHKFDPIPTRDYYSMQAVFAPVQFADVTLPYQPYENTEGFKEDEARINRLQQAGGVKSLKTIPRSEWPVENWDADSEVKGQSKVNNKRKQILQRELKRFRPLAFSLYSGPSRAFISNKPIVPPGKRQGKVTPVHILTGGSIETPGEEVSANVLSVIGAASATGSAPAFSDAFPQGTTGRRAALAKWLSDPRNPLPARVIANRVWQYHFGRGLAANPNNFGSTGKKPTHPELLDFLANYLVENGWSLKKLHRLIVTSDTWRRSTGPVQKSLSELDPGNALYTHFEPRRLTAEELRDSMLAVTGELNRKMGGVPARPEINLEVAMQPRHIMGSVAPAYQPDRTPERRNRRTIYAERIRTMRDPMLEVFNQPGLDTSCERRDSSTITPQAFTLFNSQNSHDRALALANRIAQAESGVEKRIQLAFKLCFGRAASDKELNGCLNHYRASIDKAKKTKPVESKYPTYVVRQMVEEMTGLAFYWVEDLDVYRNGYQADLKPTDVDAETRVLADICLVLLNSNEFIYVY